MRGRCHRDAGWRRGARRYVARRVLRFPSPLWRVETCVATLDVYACRRSAAFNKVRATSSKIRRSTTSRQSVRIMNRSKKAEQPRSMLVRWAGSERCIAEHPVSESFRDDVTTFAKRKGELNTYIGGGPSLSKTNHEFRTRANAPANDVTWVGQRQETVRLRCMCSIRRVSGSLAHRLRPVMIRA